MTPMSNARGKLKIPMQNAKQQVALSSIAASAALTLAKGIVGLSTGSLAILSEAAHSLIDFVATLMTYFAVRVSDKPADAEHHYGHGKVESVSALAETALLFLLSGVVIWEALARLSGGGGHAVEATVWSFVVIVGSILVDFFRARVLYRVAAETASEALEADALHFGSDMWSSVAVLIGLAAVALGYAWADAAAAVIVALFICIAGWRLGRRTIDTLTDTAPAGAAAKITAIVARVPSVVAVERVRVRQAGGVEFVDLIVDVSRTLALDRVAALKDRIEAAVHAAYPKAELSVTTEPRALDGETVLERVMVIARNRSLAVHHVTVHAIGSKLSVSLDLEVDGSLSLGVAHDIATELEEAVREEIGPGVEVETHIEPLQPHDQPGLDAPPERVAAVRDALTEIAARFAAVGEVHDVRVRRSDGAEIVNFHCQVDPLLTVAEVHERVDDVERALRARFPSIKRVIGHAEPRRGAG
jgi:cation diffusion facilitator family transporter